MAELRYDEIVVEEEEVGAEVGVQDEDEGKVEGKRYNRINEVFYSRSGIDLHRHGKKRHKERAVMVEPEFHRTRLNDEVGGNRRAFQDGRRDKAE